MFALLLAMCAACGAGLATHLDASAQWYLALRDAGLDFNPKSAAGVGVLNFLTAIVLYSNVIPISLYVSAELIKFITAAELISKDERMRAEGGQPALARTSNLNEDLGLVKFVLSDKTARQLSFQQRPARLPSPLSHL